MILSHQRNHQKNCSRIGIQRRRKKWDSHTASLVNHFVQQEHAAVDSYNHVIESVEDPVTRASLELLRNGHQHTIEQMSTFLSALGCEPDTEGGILQELGNFAESLTAKLTQSSAVSSLLEEEEQLLQNYQSALASDKLNRAENALLLERVEHQQSVVSTLENLNQTARQQA